MRKPRRCVLIHFASVVIERGRQTGKWNEGVIVLIVTERAGWWAQECPVLGVGPGRADLGHVRALRGITLGISVVEGEDSEL